MVRGFCGPKCRTRAGSGPDGQGLALGFGHEIVVRGRREAERQHKIRARQSLNAVQDVVVRRSRRLAAAAALGPRWLNANRQPRE